MTDTKPLGLYLHIPFCRKKCSYCDFYSAILHPEVLKKYVDSLVREVALWGGQIGRPINTLYIGGGTPSVLNGELVSKLFSAIKESFSLSSDCEITFEVNPDCVDEHYFKMLKACGVNRLSIGMQSGSDTILKLLGRSHTVEQSIRAYNFAQQAGFDNITVDVMLNLPKITGKGFRKTLDLLKELDPPHISAYMLILEENTALYHRQKLYDFPNDDEAAEQYLMLCDFLKEQGYTHYEISNFAKKGYKSRHNLKYWQGEEYLGIGPSAYSFSEGKRFHYNGSIKEFLSSPTTVYDEDGGDFCEYIMLCLRLDSGIRQDVIAKRFNKKFSGQFFKAAKELSKNGLCRFDGEALALTEKGMLLSNSIICTLSEEELYENI